MPLELVPAERREVADRGAEPGPGRVVTGGQISFVADHLLAGAADRDRCERQQQLPNGPVLVADADVLRHVTDAASE